MARACSAGAAAVFGTLFGALIVVVFTSGLTLANLNDLYQPIAEGLLVIAAVGLDQWIRRVEGMSETVHPPGPETVDEPTGHPPDDTPSPGATPVLEARGLVKRFGHVVGLAGVDLALNRGEVLGVIGDNGAGKSTLIKCLSGALTPDRGTIMLEGNTGQPSGVPLDSRLAGIETVYQTLAVAPALDIASNMFLGREDPDARPAGASFASSTPAACAAGAREQLTKLGITTVQDSRASGSRPSPAASARRSPWRAPRRSVRR